MITLKQLRYFEVLSRIGHFGRAAEHCAISQPALSMQVRDLEETLGASLIERSPRGLALTPAGREVAERAARILAAVSDLEDAARHRDRPMNGALRLGVIPSIAPYLLPPLLPELRATYSGLDLQIRETQTEQLVAELREGPLDVLLVALPIAGADLETLHLFDDRFVFAAPADWPVPRRVRITPDLIEGSRLLLLEEGHCLRDQALDVCGLRQVGDLDTFGASSLSTIVQMVANGMGMTLLPEMSLLVEAARSDIRLMRFRAPEPVRPVGLVWRATTARRADFEALGAAILKSRPRNVST